MNWNLVKFFVYFFVGYFGGWSCSKPDEIQKVVVPYTRQLRGIHLTCSVGFQDYNYCGTFGLIWRIICTLRIYLLFPQQHIQTFHLLCRWTPGNRHLPWETFLKINCSRYIIFWGVNSSIVRQRKIYIRSLLESKVIACTSVSYSDPQMPQQTNKRLCFCWVVKFYSNSRTLFRWKVD